MISPSPLLPFKYYTYGSPEQESPEHSSILLTLFHHSHNNNIQRHKSDQHNMHLAMPTDSPSMDDAGVGSISPPPRRKMLNFRPNTNFFVINESSTVGIDGATVAQ